MNTYDGKLSAKQIAAYHRDGYIIVPGLFDEAEIELLGRSARNDSDKPRWSMICCYNAKSNNPYKDAHHPRYTPLKKVDDAMIKNVGISRFEDDTSDVAWLEDNSDKSARSLGATKNHDA